MPRPLRFIPEHALVEITTHTLQGRLLLKPSPELTDIILGIIGKAHLVMQFVNANVAKEAGRLHLWRERLWSRRYRSIVVADEKAAHARLRYILAHGVKEGLVSTPGSWPGPNCIAALTTGEGHCVAPGSTAAPSSSGASAAKPYSHATPDGRPAPG